MAVHQELLPVLPLCPFPTRFVPCRDAGGSVRLCHLLSRGGLRRDPRLQQRRAGQVWL